MRRLGAVLGLIALLSGCGGGGSTGATGGGTGAGTGTGTTSPTAPTSPAVCSLRDRQDWAAAQLREFYLFPETLPATLDPTPYATVGDYVDALTATARAQRRDRYFTFVTSIAEEDAFYASGTSAGFGIRIFTDAAQGRLFVTDAFEGAPALAAGIDRGAEILAIGTSTADLRTVTDLVAAGGSAAVTDALGPTMAGVTRLLRIRDAGGTRDVSLAKASYALTPVSARYGARVIEDGGRKIGYVNLRSFITPADAALRQAFATFGANGVSDVIVDLRYNGGGLISVAETFGDLLGGNRSRSDVFSFTTYRPEKASRNETRTFSPQAQSIAPRRIAFIATGSTASASEVVINGMLPYLRANAALIGANTFGKPVGQIAIDRSRCDDRLRVIAFATANAARQGDYFDGLASKVEASCAAGDDYGHPLGDPQESSTRAALDFIAGRSCTPIATAQSGQSLRVAGPYEPLVPRRPTAAQREVPGAF